MVPYEQFDRKRTPARTCEQGEVGAGQVKTGCLEAALEWGDTGNGGLIPAEGPAGGCVLSA